MNLKHKHSLICHIFWSLILLNLNLLVDCDVGDPLVLTTYLENGHPELAKQLSEVNSSYMLNVTSYAGFITVNKEFNSNTWFWYFPSEKSVDSSPLIIWLQGGPGLSSLYSLFQGVGPFKFDVDVLEKNQHSWHESHSILFIDNPIGAGFSFTDVEEGYCRNQTQVTDNLYEFLQQFYQIFPELQPIPVFIVGQSYAGKHIPSLAYEIHTRNPSEKIKINLQGMAIGNGWIDPPNLYSMSTMAFQVGLIDLRQKNEVKVLENAMKIALQKSNWESAIEIRQAMVSYVSKASNTTLFNYMADKSCFDHPAYKNFMTSDEIRDVVHVGNTSYQWLSTHANFFLRNDIMITTRPLLEELLEFYPVLMYKKCNCVASLNIPASITDCRTIIVAYPKWGSWTYGHLDMVVTHSNLEKIYDTLNWTGIETYKKADRVPWIVDDLLVGYTKRAGNFEEAMFRNAGHCVANDKPQHLLNLITDFVFRKSNFDKSNEIEDIQILDKENSIDGL